MKVSNKTEFGDMEPSSKKSMKVSRKKSPSRKTL